MKYIVLYKGKELISCDEVEFESQTFPADGIELKEFQHKVQAEDFISKNKLKYESTEKN